MRFPRLRLRTRGSGEEDDETRGRFRWVTKFSLYQRRVCGASERGCGCVCGGVRLVRRILITFMSREDCVFAGDSVRR